MSLWLGLQVGLHCSWEGWCMDPCWEGWRFVEGSVLRHMWKTISLLACDDCKWWEPWRLKISQGGGDFSWCITSTHSWRVVIRVYSLAVQVFGLHYFQLEDAKSAKHQVSKHFSLLLPRFAGISCLIYHAWLLKLPRAFTRCKGSIP